MVIVDTTVWVDYLHGTRNQETEWLDREVGREEIGLTDLILCEVLQGVQGDDEYRRVRMLLSEFELFETGGEEFCIAAAENYRKLRKRGRTVRKTIDCLIATFCVRNGHSLLHRDNDFRHFEELLGLAVIHAKPPAIS
jgi:predicted nucleic acid-binding protein